MTRCTYVDECRGDDDSGTELLDHREYGIEDGRSRHELVDEDGSKDA